MEQIFNIEINMMGDLEVQKAQVVQSEEIYQINMPDGHQIAVKFSANQELVQTEGTPLDSNTLHSISEALKSYIQ